MAAQRDLSQWMQGFVNELIDDAITSSACTSLHRNAADEVNQVIGSSRSWEHCCLSGDSGCGIEQQPPVEAVVGGGYQGQGQGQSCSPYHLLLCMYSVCFALASLASATRDVGGYVNANDGECVDGGENVGQNRKEEETRCVKEKDEHCVNGENFAQYVKEDETRYVNEKDDHCVNGENFVQYVKEDETRYVKEGDNGVGKEDGGGYVKEKDDHCVNGENFAQYVKEEETRYVKEGDNGVGKEDGGGYVNEKDDHCVNGENFVQYVKEEETRCVKEEDSVYARQDGDGYVKDNVDEYVGGDDIGGENVIDEDSVYVQEDDDVYVKDNVDEYVDGENNGGYVDVENDDGEKVKEEDSVYVQEDDDGYVKEKVHEYVKDNVDEYVDGENNGGKKVKEKDSVYVQEDESGPAKEKVHEYVMDNVDEYVNGENDGGKKVKEEDSVYVQEDDSGHAKEKVHEYVNGGNVSQNGIENDSRYVQEDDNGHVKEKVHEYVNGGNVSQNGIENDSGYVKSDDSGYVDDGRKCDGSVVGVHDGHPGDTEYGEEEENYGYNFDDENWYVPGVTGLEENSYLECLIDRINAHVWSIDRSQRRSVVMVKGCKLHETRDQAREHFLSTLLSLDIASLFALDHRPVIESIRVHYPVNTIGINLHTSLPTHLPMVYRSMAHFRSIYTPLMAVETNAQIRQAVSDQVLCAGGTRCTDRSCKHYTGNRFQIISHSTTEKGCKFTIDISPYLNDKHGKVIECFDKLPPEVILKHWLVLIVNSSSTIINYGLVTEQGMQIMQQTSVLAVKFYRRISSFTNATHIWALCYFRPPIRLIETMTMIESRPDLVKLLLKPSVENFAIDNNNDGDYNNNNNNCSNSNRTKVPMEMDDYNEAQRKVIESCYSMVSSGDEALRFKLIQGPPGTGKTHILVGIVKALLSDNTPRRILVCAPSNGAIDEIARRLLVEKQFRGPQNQLLITRIGREDSVHKDVLPYFIGKLCADLEVYARERQAFLLKEPIDVTVLAASEVILSTLGSSQNAAMTATFSTMANPIDCLIVDEAGQCCEPDLLLPLVYRSISKCIMIGDHLQLPATVISLKAAQYDYGRSLFERFYLHFAQSGSHNVPVVMLTEQYRMLPEIVRFPSRQFYENRLTTAPGTGENARIPLKPYMVFNLENSLESSSKSRSKLNVPEARFILKLLRVIFDTVTLPVSVGVITFYKAQVEKLLAGVEGTFVLRKAEKECITINTVDGYQGQERDIIILSCVRAADPWCQVVSTRFAPRSVGFVQSSQRMNVAMTRAKSVNYVVLSGATFADVPHWKEFITDARHRSSYSRLDSSISLRKLAKLTSFT